MRTVALGEDVLAFHFSGSATGDLVVSPRSYRLGTAILGGRVRKVALSDHDGDLRFTDVDHLMVDVRGDGTLREIKEGAPVRMGSRGYVASVPDPAGAVVEFRSADVPPAEARKWEPRRAPRAGAVPSRPGKTLDELRREYKERKGGTFRYSLMRDIGSWGNDEAFALLLRIARHDESAEVRGRAVEAMAFKVYAHHEKTIRGSGRSLR